MRLAGAVCAVTGASSGIGRATALRLARAGASLVLAGRDEAALAEVATATGGRVVAGDLEHEAERVAAELGDVDVLVNNAGAGWAGPLAEMAAADVRRLAAVDLVAPILLARAVLPGMLARGRGRIVNVASVVAHTPYRDEAVYAAAKAGIAAFSEALRQELAGTPVGVTLVSPGVVATAFFDRRGTPYARRWPRPVAPERVADAIADAVERERAEVFVPRWLAVPARVRGAFPGLYRALVTRA